ncbi:hypothetical protein T02_3478 [Trichinella nativa]|uniref:Uncharacterized protein n=1 Tax=Trichinella nativa TaxID=6335 RepID=A0A0V1L508_9BILA|nr:hypothetical protein T02_3478 [Trichinella nativa]
MNWLFSSAIQITIDVSKPSAFLDLAMAIWRAQASSKASDRRLLQSSLLTRNRHNGVNSHCHPSTSAHGVSQTPSGPPYAEMTIWSTVCGYCSSSVRDRKAPSARVGSRRRGW